jgi:anti-sigma factor RsiW
LIAWFPSSALDQQQRSRVQRHVAGCSACADLLGFACQIKDRLRERQSVHPQADVLVDFVENKRGLEPQECALLEEHLADCSECKRQVEMLQVVQDELTAADASPAAAGRAVAGRSGRVSSKGAFWSALAARLLSPAPAAVYLALAVVALGLHLVRTPRDAVEPSGQVAGARGLPAGRGLATGAVSGAIILPDESDRVRQPPATARSTVRIASDEPQILLLELTGLESPPLADALYTVEVLGEGLREPVLTAGIAGRAFQENYTLCLPLAASALAAGRYVVRIVTPEGLVIFRSTLEAF